MSVAGIESTSGRRAVGRPSTTEPFRELIRGLLTAQPNLPTLDILGRAETDGYAGGKSALYDLVARVRREQGITPAVVRRARERAERQAARAERKAERAAQLARWAAETRERIERRAQERRELKEKRMQVREEWLVRTRKQKRVFFRPLAEDEESNLLRVHVRKWIASRESTHKTCRDDRSKWKVHMNAHFGHLEPREVDVPTIRAFVEELLARGFASSSVGNCVRMLSSLYTDLVEQGVVERNPVQAVPRALKRRYRHGHDPRTTPFVERIEDIRRLQGALPEPLRTMYAVAVMTGVRTGELVALEWSDVRSDMKLIHVQRRFRGNKVDVPKSGKGRVVPLSRACAEVLSAWRKTTGGEGPIFKPLGKTKYIDMGSWHLREKFHAAVRRVGLPPVSFYQATRHTFASQWVMAGHPIEKLSKILGHSSVMVTEIYAHLKPELLSVPDVISFGPRIDDPTEGA